MFWPPPSREPSRPPPEGALLWPPPSIAITSPRSRPSDRSTLPAAPWELVAADRPLSRAGAMPESALETSLALKPVCAARQLSSEAALPPRMWPRILLPSAWSASAICSGMDLVLRCWVSAPSRDCTPLWEEALLVMALSSRGMARGSSFFSAAPPMPVFLASALIAPSAIRVLSRTLSRFILYLLNCFRVDADFSILQQNGFFIRFFEIRMPGAVRTEAAGRCRSRWTRWPSRARRGRRGRRRSPRRAGARPAAPRSRTRPARP